MGGLALLVFIGVACFCAVDGHFAWNPLETGHFSVADWWV
jgi:hypothetical protein